VKTILISIKKKNSQINFEKNGSTQLGKKEKGK
jgi:hypothetical protein